MMMHTNMMTNKMMHQVFQIMETTMMELQFVDVGDPWNVAGIAQIAATLALNVEGPWSLARHATDVLGCIFSQQSIDTLQDLIYTIIPFI